MDDKVFLLEVKAIKGMAHNPESLVQENWLLLTAAEAEARLLGNSVDS